MKGSATYSGRVTMLLISMLVLSYSQNETIFQNKHPKDPTMQNFSS